MCSPNVICVYIIQNVDTFIWKLIYNFHRDGGVHYDNPFENE